MAKPLTDRTIRTLKPKAKRYESPDGLVPGLVLRVNRDGSKVFVLRYRRPDGRERRMKLGQFPAMKLSGARERAQKARLAVADGQDPVGKKKLEQSAHVAARRQTFEVLAADYLERYAKRKKKETSWREDERYLNTDVLPRWTGLPVSEIDRWKVIELLDTKAEKAPVAANRLRTLLSKIFAFGIQNGYVEANPVQYVEKPAKESRRDRVLTEDEIRAVWEAFGEESPVTAATFQLRLLTAQRSEELRSMRWADLDGSWWTIPSENTKNGLSHRVPLSAPARAILEALRPITGASPWVFESPSKPGHYLGRHQTASRRIRKRSGVENWTPHDLRRTAASSMASLGVPRFHISRVLNHADNSVTAIYDRHSYDEEKRRALELWGERLEAIVSGSKLADVVAIR